MKTHLIIAAVILSAASAIGQTVPVRWFEGPKGYKDAITLQEKTGKPILVWATWSDCPNCSGVTSYITRGKPKQQLQEFIRVVIDEHGRSEEAEFAKAKRFRGGTFYVIAPSSEKPKDNVWAWEGESRKILPDLELVLAEKLKLASDQ